MQRRLIFDNKILSITIRRLCHQLIESHGNFDETVVLGLQPRGIFLANRIRNSLQEILNKEIPLGYLDATFHRDDFRRREAPLRANATHIPFVIEDKNVVIIDDVLFTGRTVRAAMDAMASFGRPRKVELLVLVNRKYNRDLPIEPNYVGRHVNTLKSQKVLVEWKEQDKPDDKIWLIEKPIK
jgi:pyrimidine operon attenuation protein / uracil phosphoribosyltransferase